MNRLIIGCLGALLALPLAAAETVVDRDARLDLASGAIASDDVFLVDSGAASVTWNSGTPLPLANFFVFGSSLELGLLGDGTVDVTAGTAPDYVAHPPSVLNDAALWLEVGQNVATNASGYVTQWYDRRETSAAAAHYGYAEAYSTVLAGTEEGVVEAVRNGRKSINFRAKGSSTQLGRSLELRTSAGAAATYDMCDGFYVMTPLGASSSKNNHAPILGNTSTAYFGTGDAGTGVMLSEGGNAHWKCYACTYRHNGAIEDPTTAVDGDACHVCSFTAYNSLTTPIDSLVRDRNLAGGGAYLHEVLLFTRRLTSHERALVTAYLMQKWNVASGVVSLSGVEGTVAKVSDAQVNNLSVDGRVALSPSGETLSPSLLYAVRDTAKRYRLEANGGRLNLQGTEYSLLLADGDSLAIDDSLTTNRAVRAVAGTPGSISIAGAKRATVIDQIPATKFAATATSGDFVLRSRTAATSPYVSGGSAPATLSATTLSVPAGTGGSTVTVTIPTAGDWEVEFDIQNAAEFKTGGGWTSGDYTSYCLSLVGHTELLNKVVLAVKPSVIGGVVPHRRYLMRAVPAGTYTLQFAGRKTSALAATVSNLALQFVPNPVRETVVPMTEGDFESMSMNKPYFSSRDNLSATYTKWQIANGTGISLNPVVQSIVNSMMGVAVTTTGYNFQFRAHELGRYGDNALLWIHTNSTASAVRNTATSPATVLPAGTWKLRMKACRMTTGTEDFNNVNLKLDRIALNPVDNNYRCGKYLAKYQAKVRVNGGAAVDLGVTDEIDSFAGKTYCFPTAFTVAEGDSVVVDLDQLVGWSFSLTDDYEFVKVDETASAGGLGPELIVNGSFEVTSGTPWVRDNYTDGDGTSAGARHRVDIQSPVSGFFGATYCDGSYVARAFNAARCYQPVALEKGVYRLSYWSRARCDYEYGNKDGTPVNRCHLHFWQTAAGSSVTNEIVTGDLLWSTNFYETAALFEVKAAGTYYIGFNTDSYQVTPGNDSLVDCVSVRKVLDETAVPSVDPGAELVFRSADGKLRLDYPGTLSVKSLRVNGKRLLGEVSAETHPNVLCGPGKVLVTGKVPGLVLYLR